MSVEQMLEQIQHVLDEMKAEDCRVLDVRDMTSITDYMVICTGRSSRHVKSIAENLIADMKKQQHQPLHVDGMDSGEWVLVDFADVVVHLMRPELRAFYNLEGLWTTPTAQEQSVS